MSLLSAWGLDKITFKSPFQINALRDSVKWPEVLET